MSRKVVPIPAILALAVFAPRPLRAATLVVDDSGGAAYTSIQAAITAASSGDTVQIRAGTYLETLTLSGKNLTISGAGSSAVVVQGSGSAATFTIFGGVTVALSGLELTGGQRGLNVRQATVTADDLLCEGNVTAGSGGCLAVLEGSVLTLTDSVIRDNEATSPYHGGGLYVDASRVTLDRCEISGNQATQGGGLYASEAQVELIDTLVEGNIATGHGGGVRLRAGSTLDVSGTTLGSNSSGGTGGGASLEDSDSTWSGSTVQGNVAASGGGGLYLTGQLSAGTTFDGEISENTAGGAGGGVWVWDHDLTLGGEMRDNACPSTENGGAVYGGAVGLTLDGATVEGHRAARGGALYLQEGSTLRISSSTLQDNQADLDGGAIYTTGGLYASASFVEDNVAGGEGGALCSTGGQVTVIASRLQGNVAGGAGGGASITAGSLLLSSTGVRENRSAQGGGVSLAGAGASGVSVVVSWSAVTDNEASGAGGGIYVDSAASVQVYETEFSGNSSGGRGGGLYVLQAPAVQVHALDVRDNAALEGGGLYLDSVAGAAWDLDLAVNSALASGGGALLSAPSGTFTLRNSRSWENSAYLGAGLCLASDSAGLLLVQNVDLAGNDGDGLWLASAPGASVVNTIVASNTGTGVGSDDAHHLGTLAYDLVFGNGEDWGGVLADLSGQDGNLSADPEYFALALDGDPFADVLLLGSLSPARDAGDPSLLDLDGSRSDMGSYGGAGAVDGDFDGDGIARSGGDCDDARAEVHPGAVEVPYDGLDQDCDPQTPDDDLDGDGYAAADDCDDGDASVHPGAEDPLGDGLDQDCDGVDGHAADDTGDPDTADPPDPEDQDGDGYASPEDCNDREYEVHPAHAEICDDRLDNDCDGFVDASDGDCLAERRSCSGCSQRGRGGEGLWIAWLAAALFLSRPGRPVSGR